MFDFNNLIIINIMKKILLTSAVLLALLSSCNNDYDGPDIAGSKLIVSGNIDQVNTRVSDTGTEWTVNDAIGVSDNLSTNPNLNIKYVAGSTTGDFTSATGIYILGSEPVSYTAYYPYKGEEGTSAGEVEFSIVDSNGKYVGSSAVDFMFAEEATASRANPVVTFKFKHMMSQLRLNIKSGSAAVTKAETPITCTLRGVTTDGKFNTTDGTVTAGSTKGDVTIETMLGTPISVILPSVTASEGNKEAIQLIITVGDKVYSGTFTPELAASQEYGYEIDLDQTTSGGKLQINSLTIDGWTPNDGGNINVNEEINLNPTLEIGDFLCSDGTTIDKEASLDADMKTKIIGVVYYVGNPQPSVLYASNYTQEQDILKNTYPSCTNGLAIALNNAVNSSGALTGRFGVKQSGTNPKDYKAWLGEQADISGKYINTTLNCTTMNESYILGYNNTKVIELCAQDVDDAEQIASLSTDFIDFLSTYRGQVTVSNITEWYLPSSAELKQIQDNFAAISTSIIKADGTLTQYDWGTATDVTTDTFYWSSCIRGVNYAWVSGLVDNSSAGEKLFYPNKTSNGTKGYFRFAVAF